MKKSFIVEKQKGQRPQFPNPRTSFFLVRKKRKSRMEKENSRQAVLVPKLQKSFFIKRKLACKQLQVERIRKLLIQSKKAAQTSSVGKNKASRTANSQRPKKRGKTQRSRQRNLKLNSWDHNRIFPKVKGKLTSVSRSSTRKNASKICEKNRTLRPKKRYLTSLEPKQKHPPRSKARAPRRGEFRCITQILNQAKKKNFFALDLTDKISDFLHSLSGLEIERLASLGRKFHFHRTLGEGSNAKVKLLQEKDSKELKVVKILGLSGDSRRTDLQSIKVVPS